MKAEVVSVNAGPSNSFDLPDGERGKRSAIRKAPQQQPLLVTAGGFVGDEVVDAAHGGANRAVHLFALDSYRVFEAKAGHSLPIPTFGENLTVEGYDETMARVGDTLKVGEALLQVTMPTERCALPGRWVGVPTLLKWMIETLRGGLYLRVLESGRVAAGDACGLTDRGPEGWTIEALNRLMYREISDSAKLGAAQELPELAPEFKQRLLLHHQKRREE